MKKTPECLNTIVCSRSNHEAASYRNKSSAAAWATANPAKQHDWIIDPGKFVIHVGNSSENTPLHAGLTINSLRA